MTPTQTPTATLSPTPILDTSEALITAAWNALTSGQNDSAIEYTQRCIRLFGPDAYEQQNALTEDPPIGGDFTAAEKEATHKNWALNDVGAGYFILGQALEREGRTEEAKAAYQKAMDFPKARVWDVRGWFWSPAREAKKMFDNIP